MLASADKAAFNVLVVGRIYYINILKQELGSAKRYTYEYNLFDERTIIDWHRCQMAAM